MALIDAGGTLCAGVFGQRESTEEEKLLRRPAGIPAVPRPRVFEDREVPEVLLGGDHAKIRDWRRRQALLATLMHGRICRVSTHDRQVSAWALDATKEE